MATMKMTGCMAIVAKMPQADQDALLARLDQYQADGIPAERAQIMATNDMLEELRGERSQIFDAIAEQFPDLLTVTEESPATLSRQRDVLARIPELEQAAQGVKEGTVTREQYEELVNALKPVTPYAEVPEPATDADMRRALTSDKVERIGVPSAELKAGDPVGLRLDIPAYANHGVWVVSVHDQVAGYSAGKSIGYENVAAVTNPTFGVVETAALNIAGGKPKATIAVMKGDWKPVSEKEAVATAKLAMQNGNWVQVGMDPTRHAYFYDRASMEPVVSADEAVQIGPLVLAKNPVYGKKSDFKFSRQRQTDTPAFKRWFGDSKVVDANGEPLVVYHATAANDGDPLGFTEFRTTYKELGAHFGPPEQANQIGARAGSRVYPVYLSIKNPVRLVDNGDFDPETVGWQLVDLGLMAEDQAEGLNYMDKEAGLEAVRTAIQKAGHDGVVYLNRREGFDPFGPDGVSGDELNEMSDQEVIDAFPEAQDSWIALSPEQIKSATGNSGAFDPANPDITASRQRQTDTPEFKAWFGDSATTDDEGEPLRLYTGTSKDKDFDKFNIPKNGAWLTTNPDEASMYARENDSRNIKYQDGRYVEVNSASRVLPVYARIEKPAKLSDADSEAMRMATNYKKVQGQIFDRLRAEGYDGVDMGNGVWVVIGSSNQIKSAIGNSGEFSRTKDKMTASRQRNIYGQQMPLAQWTAPTDSKLDEALYYMQDKQIDTRRVIESIKAAVGSIDDKWNAYLQEELYHGRTAKATKDFLTDELRPLLQDMQARKVDMAELEEYLHNRHAEERNIQIAKVNPNMPDGGSGIDTADARAYLAALDPAKRRSLDALAQRVDAITASTRQLLVASGLETQDTINKWEAAYSKYVPLQREDLDFSSQLTGAGTGQGYQVKGSSSKRATGSSRPVVDILANVAMQRERAIVRSEKQRVAQAIYGLAVKHPNTDFWLAVDPAGQKDPAKAQADLVAMGINPIDAQNIVEEPVQSMVDPRTGLVTQRVNPLLRNSPNVLAVRINGEEKYVFFNASDERSQRMVSALKNLDADQLGRVMGMIALTTRWFASVNTQYNPIFGAINFTRDVQGAALNLTTTPIADKKAQVMADTLPALRGIYSDLRNQRKGRGPATGTWATLWEEFQREGGQTGFRDMFSRSAERAEALQSEFNRMSRSGYDPRRLVDPNNAVFGWLSDYNETMENAVRLAAYKAAKDKGLSNQQAASLAKNLTVNFNRKGQVATQMGALYAFFNASVQGTTRLVETLRGPAGKKIVAGGLILGTAQAVLLAAAGFDEDEPPEFVRERNLIIPLANGKYLTIPMPLGFNVIPNTSRILTEYVLSGFRDPAKRIGQITSAFLEMFNPIGNAGWSVQTIAPTIADPLVALAENRDWSGKPIAKEDRSDLNPTPGYTRAKETASWFGKQLSYYLNLATGGSKYTKGLISPTPDQIDYLIGQITGGVGREAMKVEQTLTSSVTGEELPPYKIPIVGRFYGDTKSSAAESSRFYENLKRINVHEAEIKGRIKNKDGGVAEYRQENPTAKLVGLANATERDVQQLRKRRREMLEKGASKESIQIMEQRITARMKRFNDRVKQVEEAAEER